MATMVNESESALGVKNIFVEIEISTTTTMKWFESWKFIMKNIFAFSASMECLNMITIWSNKLKQIYQQPAFISTWIWNFRFESRMISIVNFFLNLEFIVENFIIFISFIRHFRKNLEYLIFRLRNFFEILIKKCKFEFIKYNCEMLDSYNAAIDHRHTISHRIHFKISRLFLYSPFMKRSNSYKCFWSKHSIR